MLLVTRYSGRQIPPGIQAPAHPAGSGSTAAMASDFGMGLKRTADGASADETAPKMRKREVTTLMDWDFPKMLEINNKVEDGSQGDKFIRKN